MDYFGKKGGITFSGGEPLLQKEIKKKKPKLPKEYEMEEMIDETDGEDL